MKRLLLTLFVLAAVLSAPSFGRDQQTALTEFKKDLAALKTWADEKKKNQTDPLAPLLVIGEMVEKFKAINTEGLPADLKEPWEAAAASFTKVATLVGQLPKDSAEATKKLADPAFQKDFTTQMLAIQQEMMPTLTKLKDAAKKYGIEELNNLH